MRPWRDLGKWGAGCSATSSTQCSISALNWDDEVESPPDAALGRLAAVPCRGQYGPCEAWEGRAELSGLPPALQACLPDAAGGHRARSREDAAVSGCPSHRIAMEGVDTSMAVYYGRVAGENCVMGK